MLGWTLLIATQSPLLKPCFALASSLGASSVAQTSQLPRKLLSSLAPSPAPSPMQSAVSSQDDTLTTLATEGKQAAARGRLYCFICHPLCASQGGHGSVTAACLLECMCMLHRANDAEKSASQPHMPGTEAKSGHSGYKVMLLNTLTSPPGALCGTRITVFWALCFVFAVLNLVCAFYAAFYRTQTRERFNIPGDLATLITAIWQCFCARLYYGRISKHCNGLYLVTSI